MRPRVYLAGPITGLSYDGAVDWREQAKLELGKAGIDGLSPLRWKTYLKGDPKISGAPDAYQRTHPLSAPKGIVTRDRNDVLTSDAVLLNLLGAEKISIGSVIEVGWADAFRKPLVVVMEGGVEYEVKAASGAGTDVAALGKTNPHHHAMLDQLAGYIVPSLAEALYIVKALVCP